MGDREVGVERESVTLLLSHGHIHIDVDHAHEHLGRGFTVASNARQYSP